MTKTINTALLSVAFNNIDLCTRCGTCSGACPTGAISPGPNYYPTLDYGKCVECGLCKKTCPGGKVNFQDLTNITFGQQPDNPSFDGHIMETYVGYATDSKLREIGSGGGVATALMWDLLKHADISGCLVTRMSATNPTHGEYFIARSLSDLLDSQGSKYTIIPHNALLARLRDLPGKFAYVGLPCQVHGLRLLCSKDKKLNEKISLVVGLFCGGALEINMPEELMRTKNIDLAKVNGFRFRGGEWPGKMQAVKEDGVAIDLHYADYKDGAYNYLTYLYSPIRCLTCIDGSNHFADIAIGDVWTRDKEGNYRYKGHSRIFARTNKGVQALRKAIQRKTLVAEDVTSDPDYRTHQAHTTRKGILNPLRIARLATQGIAVPQFDRKLTIEPTSIEKLKERVVTGFHYLSRIEIFRRLLLRFLFSDLTIPLIKLRKHIKSRKYRKK